MLTQLTDLDELKDELGESEYNESRDETLEQIKEFNSSLDKMAAGDMTLVDDIGKVQLTIQSAIRSSFQSPEVIAMFEKKENSALRYRLVELEESFKLGRITEDLFTQKRRDILLSLDKLGDDLSSIERSYIFQVLIFLSMLASFPP